jgi:translation initiation factor 3 subunit H
VWLQLSAKELYENSISWGDVFAEVPVKISNSPLVTALMAHIDEHVTLSSIEATRLRLNTQPFLEKQLDRIGDGIESLYLEVQDMTAYERSRVRQEHQKALWLQRRVEVRLPLYESKSAGPKLSTVAVDTLCR